MPKAEVVGTLSSDLSKMDHVINIFIIELPESKRKLIQSSACETYGIIDSNTVICSVVEPWNLNAGD